MERFLEKSSDVMDNGHCIVKEELIIQEEVIKKEKLDEEIFGIQNNNIFSDYYAEMKFEKHGTPNKALASRRNGRLKNKILCADVKIETNLNMFVNSENAEGNDEKSEDSTESINNTEFKGSVTTMHDIDELAKEVAKAYCKKCRNDSEAIRQKSQCDKCNTPLSYACRTCDKTYSTFVNLRYHLKVKHIEVHFTYPCSICGQTFREKKILMIHRRTQHNVYESQECSKCSRKFNRSVNRMMHEKFCGKNAHVDNQANLYKCDKCFFKTRYKNCLNLHKLQKHTEGFKAECSNCSRVFKNKRSMRRHEIYYCNKAKKLECDFCGHKVYRKDQMVIHINMNHMIGYYSNSNTDEKFKSRRICQNCSLMLRPYERMKTHLIECKSDLKLQGRSEKHSRICKFCNETLKPREHMRYHIIRCESAPLTFRYAAERAKLPDIDTALKKLAISYCVKCQTKQPLNAQVRRCSKCDKLLRYDCVNCSKNFFELYRLRRHLQQYVWTSKFYRCDKCHCSYKRKWNLIVHHREVHLNKQSATNYKCKNCGKEYKRRETFRRHLISCGQEPRFNCDQCSYRTYFKSSIITHIWAKRGTCI